MTGPSSYDDKTNPSSYGDKTNPSSYDDKTKTPPARLDYVELPVADSAASAAFFQAAFGWTLTVFGPHYAATTTGDVDLGLQADPAEAVAAPLAIVRVADLDAALAAVEAAGGTITRQPFGFPGGRRFHFREPGGNELAAWVTTGDDGAGH